ncbi:hypothetical protein [Aurantiacibacter rhizosphaerae]|uniref:Uncharacterized protein n=1 Tax=Aurantiacibacter rhizosphaerae TaxID=2691582 RepID=A0A844XHN8_9SPHN|nr:hypothetical protein [Aurantiacibacter rhizosphaerae]MWV29212.1 hypothetical protein [Aurantiacibacter rhizosphaerae]
MKKPKGRAGSWFAEWDGENLPCVHKFWTEGIWPEYADKGFDDRPEWGPFIEALQEKGRAILTTSHPQDADGNWRRKSYIGIWSVSDVRVTDNKELRFTFGDLLHRF